jgi:histidinol-phosphate phosphatase family protein
VNGPSPAPLLRYDVVIPTIGRPSLARLLDALTACPAPARQRIVVVDDRRPDAGVEPLRLEGKRLAQPTVQDGDAAAPGRRVFVMRSHGRGPAAARNVGWRACASPWIVFLDDDVVPDSDWSARLQEDLRSAGAGVGGVQARIAVPLPARRRPTDWERNVAGLEGARWATADLAYRRAALEQVGGFDERFGRNYREDADLGLRVVGAGWAIERGSRRVVHPVGPADRWTSLRLQRGNADDALMRRLHGSAWRGHAAAPRGRLPRHLATSSAGLAALALSVAGRRRTAALAAAGWLAGTAELAWARIAPGPRTRDEVATMAATSAALPVAASWWRLAGEWRWRDVAPATPRFADGRDLAPRIARSDADHRPARDGDDGRRDPGAPPRGAARAASTGVQAPPAAVLFDRDGTLVEDVPYNADPWLVQPMPGALDALAALRSACIPTAVVSNQSGIARGLLSDAEVTAVNERIDGLLGGVGPWFVCPHGPDAGCDCRKPQPGLVLAAARELGVAPERCVVIGDIGADVDAARAAGARSVLVPTVRTRPEEIETADAVAVDLLEAVRLVLGQTEAVA